MNNETAAVEKSATGMFAEIVDAYVKAKQPEKHVKSEEVENPHEVDIENLKNLEETCIFHLVACKDSDVYKVYNVYRI